MCQRIEADVLRSRRGEGVVGFRLYNVHCIWVSIYVQNGLYCDSWPLYRSSNLITGYYQVLFSILLLLAGSEDDLALKVQAMIDGCNDVCLEGKSEPQDKACQRFEEQAALCTKRKRLSDAILTVQTPCQASFRIYILCYLWLRNY